MSCTVSPAVNKLPLFKRSNLNRLRYFVFFGEKKTAVCRFEKERLCWLPIPGTHGWRSSICGANATTTHAYDFPGTEKPKHSRGNRPKLCSVVAHVKLPLLMQGTHAGGRYFAFVTRLPKVKSKGWSGHVPAIGSGIDDGNDVAGSGKLELSIAGGGKCS